MAKIGPREQRLREQREANANALLLSVALSLTSAERPPVTEKLRKSIVTCPSIVTKRAKPAGSGRKRVHETGADRQKAYRERQRAAS